MTPDGKKVIIPNNSITAGNIVNITAEGKIRVEMTFGIGYEDDIRKAKEIMEGILEADERVLADPAPTVAVSGLADSSVNFAVFPWVHPSNYWGVWFDTHEAVKLALDEAGISIPFPQQDVHMHQAA
jgi:small conductance mechanosensitive channel